MAQLPAGLGSPERPEAPRSAHTIVLTGGFIRDTWWVALLCPQQGLYTLTAGKRLVSSKRLTSYQFALNRMCFL